MFSIGRKRVRGRLDRRERCTKARGGGKAGQTGNIAFEHFGAFPDCARRLSAKSCSQTHHDPKRTMTGPEPVIHGEIRLDGRVGPAHGGGNGVLNFIRHGEC
jgi:hypothetical protein